uniref:Mos1 transposase HTH domain-containing protein n=1 Tax=Glossina austeni TaxID=7395 RepID=A0A1A9UDJ9_GLOAU
MNEIILVHLGYKKGLDNHTHMHHVILYHFKKEWKAAQSFGNVNKLFAEGTINSIDGKQGRRTNTSSSLGKLFDRGCDSISNYILRVSYLSCDIQSNNTVLTLRFVVTQISPSMHDPTCIHPCCRRFPGDLNN